MKFWDKFSGEESEGEDVSLTDKIAVGVGFIIGIGIVIALVGMSFLFSGWIFSLLWNHSVASLFEVTQISAIQTAVLLFLIFAVIRFFKFLLRY